MKPLAVLALLLLAGCAAPRGEVVSSTSTVFGLDISAAQPNYIPAIRAGLVRSEVIIAPTGAVYGASTSVNDSGLFKPVTVTRSVTVGK